jgi:hypothetical protein
MQLNKDEKEIFNPLSKELVPLVKHENIGVGQLKNCLSSWRGKQERNC